MVESILKAKHWQVFLFTTVLPVILLVIMLIAIVQFLPEFANVHTNFILFFSSITTTIVLFIYAGFAIWLWSIGEGLQPFIPSELRQNTVPFKVALGIPVVTLILFLLFLLLIFLTSTKIVELREFLLTYSTPVLLTLNMLSLFSVIICTYFAAKTIKLAERRSSVLLRDYTIEHLMLWIFPLGIWMIQPRVNKIIAEGAEGDD